MTDPDELAVRLANLMPDRRVARILHESDAVDLARVIAQAFGITPFAGKIAGAIWSRAQQLRASK